METLKSGSTSSSSDDFSGGVWNTILKYWTWQPLLSILADAVFVSVQYLVNPKCRTHWTTTKKITLLQTRGNKQWLSSGTAYCKILWTHHCFICSRWQSSINSSTLRHFRVFSLTLLCFNKFFVAFIPVENILSTIFFALDKLKVMFHISSQTLLFLFFSKFLTISENNQMFQFSTYCITKSQKIYINIYSYFMK